MCTYLQSPEMHTTVAPGHPDVQERRRCCFSWKELPSRMLHILYTIAQTVLRRTRLRAQETIEARGCLRRVKFLQRVLPGGKEGDRLVRAGPLVPEMLLGADPHAAVLACDESRDLIGAVRKRLALRKSVDNRRKCLSCSRGRALGEAN